ncbi:MAG: hypothetical protein WBD31_11435 [Rubripirellula sp.]
MNQLFSAGVNDPLVVLGTSKLLKLHQVIFVIDEILKSRMLQSTLDDGLNRFVGFPSGQYAPEVVHLIGSAIQVKQQ